MLFEHSFFFSILLAFIEKLVVSTHMLLYFIEGNWFFLFHQLFHLFVFNLLLFNSLFFVSLLHFFVQRLSCIWNKFQVLTLNLFSMFVFNAFLLSFYFDSFQHLFMFFFFELLIFTKSLLHASYFKLFFLLSFFLNERVISHLFLLHLFYKLLSFSRFFCFWLDIW